MFVECPKRCLVLVVVLLTAEASAADSCNSLLIDPVWNKIYHSNTLTLYEPANLADSPELTARVNWHTSPDVLYQIIWDYAQFRKHIPGVEKSEVLQEEYGRKWVYQQLKLPAPLRNRHYVLESTNLGSQPDRHYYQVEWQLSHRFPLPANRLVRPTAFSGCWFIRPDKEGGLEALYHIVLDPSGNVPRWIAQRGMRQYVRRLIEHLHRLLQLPSDSSSQ